MERVWRTPTRGEFQFFEMLEGIKKFVLDNPYSDFEIRIGTDSQRHGDKIKFVTSIVVLKVGNGGQYYFMTEEDEYKYYKSTKNKIIRESNTTYQYKHEVKESLEDFCIEHNIPIIPDVDVGESELSETRKYIAEATSMFKGEYSDEQVRIKPYSIASSCIANKHSK